VRSVFFGTPEIALPALRALHATSEVVGVVCQPDRPKGRGLSLSEPAVKTEALRLGLEVHQPLKVKDGELQRWLESKQVECAVVLAYGRILPQAVLDTPTKGCLNLHASLLPKYRGAAPIQWALMKGERETGISLMQMDVGLDTGPVYTRRTCPISETMDAGELASVLAELAATVVREDLTNALGGQKAEPQDEALASWAPPIGPEHTRLDWKRSSVELHNQVRGLAPRPGTVTTLETKRLRILKTLQQPEASGARTAHEPGEVVVANGDQLWVATGSGLLRILEAQVEGKRALPARDLINGRVFSVGQRLGAEA
jgi:methionyl-tRNA formyltransferase